MRLIILFVLPPTLSFAPLLIIPCSCAFHESKVTLLVPPVSLLLSYFLIVLSIV